MDSFPETLERAAEIVAVERALSDRTRADPGGVAAYAGRLVGERPVRLFALRPPAREPLREAFEAVRTEWELAGQHPGVTGVLASGDEPVPWLAVEQVRGESFREIGPALSGPERWEVIAGIAETLYQVGTAHLVCHPGLIHVDREEGLAVRLDWAIDRVRLSRDTDGESEGESDSAADLPDDIRSYVAPEVRADRSAGDQRSDVYSLGKLAQYGRSGNVSPGEGADSHRPGATPPESPVKVWVANRATNADPDRRFDSPYAFKRAALFGPTATGDAPVAPEKGASTPRQQPASGGSDRAGAPGKGPGSEGGEGDGGGPAGGESPDGSAGIPSRVETPIGEISRRQALGAAAGATLAGTAALLGYWTRDGSAPEEPVAAAGVPGLSASFEFGMLTLRNTGTEALETRRVVLSGDGFPTVPGQRLSGYVDDEELPTGGIVRVPADPAYELNVYYEREAEPLELVDSDGPAAGERDPRPGPLYVPEAAFRTERRDSRLQVEYDGEAAVPADHVRFVGFGFGGAPDERWDERLGTDRHDTIRRGDFTRYQVIPETVLRVEWAPPYLAGATTLAHFEGGNRPLEPDRGGVSGPRYDRGNTGSAPSGTALDRQPTAAWSTELDDDTSGALAVGSGRVFASTGRYLYALDAIDGEVLWRQYVESGQTFEPVVDGNTVYVGTTGFGEKSRLLAFDATDGTERWAFAAETAGLRSPTVSGGIVFTAGTSSASAVHVVDPTDGSGEVIEDVGAQVGNAAFDGQRLYLRTVTGEITAVGPREVDWSYPADGDLPPTVVHGTVYGVDDPTGGTARLFALDAQEGAEQWSTRVDGDIRIPQAVGGGTVFTGTDTGVVSAVDAASGELRWTTDTDARSYYGIVTTDESVYLTGLRSVTALASEDGQPRWSLEVDPLVGTVPAVSGNCLYLGTGGTVSAFCAPASDDT